MSIRNVFTPLWKFSKNSNKLPDDENTFRHVLK